MEGSGNSRGNLSAQVCEYRERLLLLALQREELFVTLSTLMLGLIKNVMEKQYLIKKPRRKCFFIQNG